jgi:hypothetical protein
VNGIINAEFGIFQSHTIILNTYKMGFQVSTLPYLIMKYELKFVAYEVLILVTMKSITLWQKVKVKLFLCLIN